MKIAVLGTGGVGNTIGARLIELGHEVIMGSRSETNEKALAFTEKHPGKASAATFANAIKDSDMVINCTKGDAAVAVLEGGKNHLKDKVVVDIANPLDFSNGMPPCLIPSLSNTWSLGEEIQKNFPETKVVKTLNTMWCGLMVNPKMIGSGDHVNYMCGNDASAKQKVIGLLEEIGWKKENILDLGDISNSRATEAVLPIWLRVWGVTKNGAFNFRIIS
jgi:predicted dinucleotide-binding enzyme